MDPSVELRNIVYRSDAGRLLFDRASVALYSGSRTLVCGQFASGKGAIVSFLAGLTPPQQGEVRLFGTDITAVDRSRLDRIRRRIGFVFEDSVLVSNLKVIENVALPLHYHTSLSYQESMRRALDLLVDSGYVGDVWALPGPLPLYSKKTVALARAIALKPDVVVFENQETGLTSEERNGLCETLVRYQKAGEGRLLVFTSGDCGDAALVEADRVVEIRDKSFVDPGVLEAAAINGGGGGRGG